MAQRRKAQQGGAELFCVCSADLETDHGGRIIGGQSDIALTEDGLKRAQELASRIRKSRLPIRTIFSSPLLRAIQTADTIHDFLNVKLRVIEPLRERNFGQWEGRPIAEISDWPEVTATPPGGESLEEFKNRVRLAIQTVKAEAEASGSVLIVAHPHLIRAWISLGPKVVPSDIDNGVIYRMDAKPDHWSATRI